MSSPEAHSSSSNRTDLYQENLLDPRADEYVADMGNQAYSAELQDGDASPEVAPLDPEVQAEYEEEERNAREALHNAEGPIRHAYQDQIDKAMSDLQVHRAAEADAKPGVEKNDKKAAEIDKKIEERRKIVKKLRDELDAQNKIGKKYRTSTNKLRWHEEKLRNLEEDKQNMVVDRQKIDDKVAKSLPSDAERNKGSYRELRENLRGIDQELDRRHKILAQLEDANTEPSTRKVLEDDVARWQRNASGEIETDDEVRARLTQSAGDTYGEALVTEAQREKEMQFEDAFDQISEKFSKDLEALSLPDLKREDYDSDAEYESAVTALNTERQKATVKLTEADAFRKSLISSEDMLGFQVWAERKAHKERKEEREEKQPKVDVAEAAAKKAATDEENALNAVNSLAENMKKLSSKGDVLASQLAKLTAQSAEMLKDLGPITDPVVKAQMQEAMGRVEKEMQGIVAEQNDIAEKIAEATKSTTTLDEAYQARKANTVVAIKGVASAKRKLEDSTNSTYLNKLRIAGL
jgi:hypothetical protein